MAVLSSLVGTFALLNHRSLLSDSVAHSVLPGICLAFIYAGEKNVVLLLIGAFLTGWLSVLTVDYLSRKTKLSEDAGIAVSLTFFFALGLMLLIYVQNSGNANVSGLNSFLFGNVAALLVQDVYTYFFLFCLTFGLLLLLYRGFSILIFDKNFAYSIGFPVKTLQFILSSLIILCVTVAIQTLGVVLVVGILITPAATARYWTNSLKGMLVISSLIAVTSSLIGVWISYHIAFAPTGPFIVVVLTIFALFSVLFSFRKGVVFEYIKNRKNKKLIQHENLLKNLYKNFLDTGISSWTSDTVQKLEKNGRKIAMKPILIQLRRLNYLVQVGSYWQLTNLGIKRAKRLIKLHRLWEVYLNTKLKLSVDHIHNEAETIEHIITPELELYLEKILNYPATDPHNSPIGYD